MKTPKRPVVGYGRIAWPKLLLDAPDLYQAALRHYDGMRVRMTIEPEVERRRDRANRYYWSVILGDIARDTGHEPEALHEWFRHKFNARPMTDPETGEEIMVGWPTRTHTIEEFSIYLERVMLWAAERLGMTFPPPRQSENWRQDNAKRPRKDARRPAEAAHDQPNESDDRP